MTLPRLSTILALSLATTSCFLSGGSDDERSYTELRDCWDGHSDAEVIDNVVISEDYADSLHEMVACGTLTVLLCNAVVSGIVGAISQGAGDATPNGWTFEAGGTYRTQSEGAVMTLQMFSGDDYEFVASGELITENVFLVDNYFVDAVVDIDFGTGRTELRFSEVGPLVELLGFGADPPNPLPLGLGDIETVNNALARLAFETDVVVDDVRTSTIRYNVISPRLRVSELLGGAGLGFELVSVDGERPDLDAQTLAETSWDIEFVDVNGGALNGSSTYDVRGGRFDFNGTATFAESNTAETTLTCP